MLERAPQHDPPCGRPLAAQFVWAELFQTMRRFQPRQTTGVGGKTRQRRREIGPGGFGEILEK